MELLKIQIRIIGALMLRETRATFGSSRLGYLWAILMPTASISLLVFIFSVVKRQPPYGQSLALFFATGVLTLGLFSKLSGTLMNTLSANKMLFTYPIVKPLDTFFARTLLIAATYFVVMLVFYLGLVFFGFAQYPSHFEKVIEAFFLVVLLGFGFGVLNAILVSFWPSWKHVESLMSRPLFFLSGIFYVPSYLPPRAIAILKWNPLLQVIEWFREGYYPSYKSNIVDSQYLVLLVIFLCFFALLLERLTRKKRSSL